MRFEEEHIWMTHFGIALNVSGLGLVISSITVGLTDIV